MNSRERDLAILKLANSINLLFDKDNFQLDEAYLAIAKYYKSLF